MIATTTACSPVCSGRTKTKNKQTNKNNNPLSDQMSDREPVGADILTSINKSQSRRLSSVNSM